MSTTNGETVACRSKQAFGRRVQSILVAIAVLMVALALVCLCRPRFASTGLPAMVVHARTDIASLGIALGIFQQDTGRYPTTKEGLTALVQPPEGIQGWRGPYIHRRRSDPWGNPYVYACPGTHNTNGYDLHFFGPSGKDGGKDNIDNWSAR